MTFGSAATVLRQIGPAAKTAIPTLTELLKDKEAKVRAAAAGALGKIGPDAMPAIPVLAELLKDQNRLVRSDIALALWE